MTTTQIERKSAVTLPGRPVRTELRNRWNVVLDYADEGTGPWLVDLSHCTRLDVQSRDMRASLPPAFPLPDTPGGVQMAPGIMIARMNPVQACVWFLRADIEVPQCLEITDITEGALALALLGENVFRIAEKLTDLDLQSPKLKAPFLLQGPFCHVPCQVMVLGTDPNEQAIVLTCSRGYAHDMVHAVLEAGEEFGLHAAGEDRFHQMMDVMAGSRAN